METLDEKWLFLPICGEKIYASNIFAHLILSLFIFIPQEKYFFFCPLSRAKTSCTPHFSWLPMANKKKDSYFCSIVLYLPCRYNL
jgi:hypothetical protein